MDISSKLKLIDELFPDGRFDTYFARSLGEKTGVAGIKKLWAAHAADVKAGRAPDFFMLYSHTPFCVSRCSYCIYDSSVVANRRDLETHLYRMSRECAALGPVLSDLRFNCLLVGGGTPGLQPDRNFDLMLKTLSESFSYRPGCIRSVEMTPATTTRSKTAIMAKHGINRVSLGVQSATPSVLEAVNRGYQTMDQIREAVASIRAEGIEEVSIDLIAGLPGETAESFLRAVSQVADCRPDTIVLYRFQEPGDGREALQPSELSQKHSWDEIVAMFFNQTRECGYGLMDERYDFSAACLENANSKWLEVNNLQSEIGSTIIGLGALSFTNIFGRANYFNHGPENKADINAGDAYQVQPSSLELEAGTCVRRFIEFNRELPRGEYAKYFGADPVAKFSDEFAFLSGQGKADISDDFISWHFGGKDDASRHSGLFFDERLLHEFRAKEKREGCDNCG